MTLDSSLDSSLDAAPRRAYARLWRWHFYAAFLVIPFVLWQGTTGVLYLWHQEIADALWPQLRFVEIGEARASLDAQVEVATIVHGGAPARLIKLPAAPVKVAALV